MRILIAEDEPISRRVLEATLAKWGHEVLVCCDGSDAWQTLQREDAPPLVILDWMMPGMDGVEICQRLRATRAAKPVYIILLTAKGRKEDIIAGLEAGADDYIIKPFDREELRARLQVGVRILKLQSALADRVRELQEALSRVKRLQGLLPICSYCKRIRDDRNYWQQVEAYVAEHSDVQFSHSVCPECYGKFVKPMLEKLNSSNLS